MKYIPVLLLLQFLFFSTSAQKTPAVENLVVITLDGMRWQDVFKGMDSVITADRTFNQGDSAEIYQKYWAASAGERRSRLMPFLWSEIAQKGQIYGNRSLGSRVENANPYWFSYPGYSEIFCGYVDTLVNSNEYPPNPNTTVLEFIHQQPGFKGKVAAFGAWDAFDRILNEKRAGFPVVSGSNPCGGDNPSPREQIINDMKRDAYSPFGLSEQLDVFTHYAAMEYLKTYKPRVLYISYGETDEWAHHGHYRDYLDAAHQTDAWIAQLWQWLQSDKQYQGKTALFITVDHGRGDTPKANWTSHNARIPGANEIWFAAMGPGIAPLGEAKNAGLYQQRQFAQTFAQLLGLQFNCEHPVAEAIKPLLPKK